ncbi:hypothetical protein GQ457_05G020390 [Hibiscus cannabinus]
MGNLGTDTPPLVQIPGELTRGYRYPYSGIDTWCITRGTDTLPSRYRYPNSSVGFGHHTMQCHHAMHPITTEPQDIDSRTTQQNQGQFHGSLNILLRPRTRLTRGFRGRVTDTAHSGSPRPSYGSFNNMLRPNL